MSEQAVADFGIHGFPARPDGVDWVSHRHAVLDGLPPVFSTVWISDHLLVDDEPWPDCWTLLTWHAAASPRSGQVRPDLDAALDCDLGACPLTNTMPILRHGLHQHAADEAFAMAFIEVPGLRVVASKQRYTHLRLTDDGAIVRYRSGSFQSDLAIDRDGFVVDYPTLGRRLAAASVPPGIRVAGAGSARPEG